MIKWMVDNVINLMYSYRPYYHKWAGAKLFPNDRLVGGDWNMNFMNFHSVGNGIIIPIDKV